MPTGSLVVSEGNPALKPEEASTMTIEPAKYEVRLNDVAVGEMWSIIDDVKAEIDRAETDEGAYLHEFVRALPSGRVAVRRKDNSTWAYMLTVEGIHDLAKELAYRSEWNMSNRAEHGSYDRDTYADFTRTINNCEAGLKSCNAVLTANGRDAVRSYFY